MEKAIDIKRRAQRCIQNGDLDGALNEYEKLVDSEESDPYNYVLLADLLYKKGDQVAASERYLAAVGAYERASLFKNAIAVCKKMLRLSLSPSKVLHALGNLHALDGLSGEAALYYVQYAEHMVRASAPADAANALRQAFDVSQENVRVLEQLSEAWLLAGENGHAAQALTEAACHYRDRGSEADARRCLDRAAHLDPTLGAESPAAPSSPAEPANGVAAHSAFMPDHRNVDLSHDSDAPPVRAEAAPPPPDHARLHDLESGRHDAAPVAGGAPLGPDDAAEPVEPGVVEYVLDDEDETTSTGTFAGYGGDEPEETEAVYEIADDEVIPYDAPVEAAQSDALRDEAAEEPVDGVAEESDASPAEPGLSFAPVASGEAASTQEELALAEVEALLTHAQEQFRSGERDEASHTLTRAAQAYELHDRLENAATIYRSLGRGAHSTPEILELWLGNCERRQDVREGATVACDLGDRALNDGDEQGARGWFERALALDEGNEIARRRLERLSRPEPAPVAVADSSAGPEAAEGAAPSQRVEIAVGRAEAVSFDLQGLLAEFQRGVDAQLAGDAQSHYDLAMTYREMGLLDQAVESFRNAGTDAQFAARSAEMVARCMADQGRYQDASREFARALGLPGVSAENDIELRYHFGNTLVELGRLEEALPEYEAVLERMPDFEDASERLDALRRTLGRG